MKLIDIKDRLKNKLIFTANDVKKIDTQFHVSRLTEWQKKKYILKVKRGKYIFISNDSLYLGERYSIISNQIYEPSYVSLETALSRYNLIPEGVFTTTAVSTRKTTRFQTPVGSFSYRHISPNLFWGYEIRKVNGQKALFASIEKTVLDYLYLNPFMVQDADFYEWRFNAEEFLEKVDMKKFKEYAKRYKQIRFQKVVAKFLQNLKDPKLTFHLY